MAEPSDLRINPNGNLVLRRRYHVYNEYPQQRGVYLVEEYYFDDFSVVWIKTLRAFVDLD